MVGIGTIDFTLPFTLLGSRFSVRVSASAKATVRPRRSASREGGQVRFWVRGSGFAVRRDEEEQHSGRGRKAGAGRERGGRAEALVEEAEDHARGQRADAEGGIVETEGGAVAIGGGEVRDERLLRAFGEREVDAVQQEP